MMKKIAKKILYILFLFSSTGIAYADDGVPNTLGALINNLGSQLYKYIPMLLIVGCYVFAIWLAADALKKLYENAKPGGGRGGENGSVWIKLSVAGMMAVLPSVMNVGIESIFNSVPGAVSGGHVYSPQECLVGTSDDSAALTCVARNIGINVVPVGIKFIFAGMWISGMCIFIKSLYSIAKHHNSPHQGGMSKQIGHIFVSCIMLAMPTFINTVTTTMGYGNMTVLTGNAIGLNDSVPSLLAYNGDGTNSDLTKFHELISWSFVIISLFGVWFVAVGCNKLNAGVDGGGQQERNSIRSAMTHIIGGSIMVNGKLGMCLIVSTFVGGGHGFC